jgi:predicted nucleotidyltransferase
MAMRTVDGAQADFNEGMNIGRRESAKVLWAVTPEKVKKAISKIVETSNPRKVILFGSCVRGSMGINSDLDILVVANNDLDYPRKESGRIRRALRGISMPMDILVLPEGLLNEMIQSPGLFYWEAVNNGKVVYESTQ